MVLQTFAFGKNWKRFVRRYLTRECIKIAEKSLVDFCYGNPVKGKTFIDIGCGSGLFSLAAYRLGASRIVSFDKDRDSVKCTRYLRQRQGSPTNWLVKSGSILDRRFIAQLGTYDFVYAWGVLHHTGKMWEALKNTTRLVKEGGLLYVSIYNRVDGFGVYPDGRFGSSHFWLNEKLLFSHLPSWLQNVVVYVVMLVLLLGYIVTFKNPIKQVNNHIKYRGMAWRTDIKDWLGGYPYEYATISEVFAFVKSLGFTLENIKSTEGLGNNEYLFRKTV